MKNIVIIGNGISGVTAAKHLRKLGDYKITIISSETKYFFSRTALMYIYMGHMTFNDTKPYEDSFWEQNKINLIYDRVETIIFDKKQLNLQSGKSILYDELILAVGSKSNKFGWPGQDLKGVQGLYSYHDEQKMEAFSNSTKKAVISGGGLIGIEMAEMFLSRNIKVTFLVREKSFWNAVLPAEESAMINRLIQEHHIELLLGEELDEIQGDANGRAKAVKTKSGKIIECQFVGLTAGVSPNIDFLKNTALEVDRGILINTKFETNLPNVYAIGDCAQFRVPLPNRRPLEQVWYTGKMHGETVARIVHGESIDYQPNTWFNSAKFLDIEYQTYGLVPAQLLSDQSTFYWEDKKGKKSIRINFMKASRCVTGFNYFGMRARQDVCIPWIENNTKIEDVLTHLGSANFDPEFFKQHESEVVSKYNKENPNNSVTLKTKRGLFSAYIKEFIRN